MGVTQGTCLGLLLFTVWKELGRHLSGYYSQSVGEMVTLESEMVLLVTCEKLTRARRSNENYFNQSILDKLKV